MNRRRYRKISLARQLVMFASVAACALTLAACGSNSSASPSESSGPSSTHSTSSGPTVITGADTWNHIGEYVTVKFYVASTGNSEGTEFLNQNVDYKTGFTAVIFSSAQAAFFNDPASTYDNQTVSVTGYLQSYNGQPQIIISSPQQISLG